MATPAKTPEEVIADYKRALVRAKGEEYAAETDVDYENGWFRVRNVDGTKSSYRRQQILFITESLLEADFDIEAYAHAVDKRKAAERRKSAQIEAQRQLMSRPILQAPAQPALQKLVPDVWVYCLTGFISMAMIAGLIWAQKDVERMSMHAKQSEYSAKEIEAKLKAEEREEQKRKQEAEYAARAAQNPPSQSRFFPDPDSGFKTVLGDLRIGTKLYRKSGYRFYGVVTAIEWGRVEVALVDSVSINASGAHGYAVWLDRTYVTDNFVTKK